MDKLSRVLETTNEINILYTFFSFILCIISSFILKYTYENKGNSLSNKNQISNILPILSCVTFLVISVVKSSLALSLGLVGALSIVRFRTPIKEPEELVFLFLSIGLGVGYAAGQNILTIIVFIITLIVIVIISRISENKVLSNYNLVIEIEEPKSNLTKTLEEILNKNFPKSEITFVKYDKISNKKEIYIFKINFFELSMIDNLNNLIKSKINSNFNLNVYNSSSIL